MKFKSKHAKRFQKNQRPKNYRKRFFSPTIVMVYIIAKSKCGRRVPGVKCNFASRANIS